MNLGSLVAEGTMRAAAELVREKEIDLEELCVSLRFHAKKALDRILDQGKTLLDSGNPGWLESMVKVECIEAARAAIAEVESL